MRSDDNVPGVFVVVDRQIRLVETPGGPRIKILGNIYVVHDGRHSRISEKRHGEQQPALEWFHEERLTVRKILCLQ